MNIDNRSEAFYEGQEAARQDMNDADNPYQMAQTNLWTGSMVWQVSKDRKESGGI